MRNFVILIAKDSDRLKASLRFEARGTAKQAKKLCLQFLNITGYEHAGITFFGKYGDAIYWYKYENGIFEKGKRSK